jgi:ACT domain-containing protein
VVYFPFDSCLPDELSNRLQCKKILKGPLQNRVKTAILRGEVSQGTHYK